jgi:hypothetical protein
MLQVVEGLTQCALSKGRLHRIVKRFEAKALYQGTTSQAAEKLAHNDVSGGAGLQASV